MSKATHRPYCYGCHEFMSLEEAATHRCKGNPIGDFHSWNDDLEPLRMVKQAKSLPEKEAVALQDVKVDRDRPRAIPLVDQGWQCPLCQTVYSPRVNSCTCKVDGTTTGNPRPQPMTLGVGSCSFCGGVGGYHNPACSWFGRVNASAGSTA